MKCCTFDDFVVEIYCFNRHSVTVGFYFRAHVKVQTAYNVDEVKCSLFEHGFGSDKSVG